MSIKSNRHKMAAFLVAILCITTIFSLFPVTAFAACSHPNKQTYYGNNLNGTHRVDVVCLDCEETISSKDVSCSYDSKGECVCTAWIEVPAVTTVTTTKTSSSGGSSYPTPSSCPHTVTNTYYSSNNDGTHGMETVCLTCEKTLIDKDVPCNYMNNGVCEDCTFDKSECGHFGDKDITYTPNYNGTHTTVKYCYVCYKTYARDTVICTYVNGYCMYCGASVDNSDGGTVCTHTVTNTYYSSNNDGTHRMETVCLTCEKTLIDKDVPCNYMNNGVCEDCTFDKGECGHSGNIDITYASTGAGRHYVKKYCYTCYKYFSVELVDCVMLKGICTMCGYLCPHPESDCVIKYYSLADGKHEYTEFCNSCECVIYDRVEECTFELFRCIHCFYYQPNVGIYEDVPKNAKAAYVYQDDDGNWLVKCQNYYGGINRLNLLDNDFYVHNNSSVKVTHYTSNSVVVQDLDGAVNKSNSKIIDVPDLPCNVSLFEAGKTYKFVATLDSIWSYSQILLKVSSSSGTKYLSPGGEFVYEAGMSLDLNIKTNSSTTKSYGMPFTVTITDIGIIPSGEYYEPFGLRYFNNDMSLTRYKNFTASVFFEMGKDYAFLDYLGSIATGNVSFNSYYKSIIDGSDDFGYSQINFQSGYAWGSIDNFCDKYGIYDKLHTSSSVSYNQGYTDGYGSAVRDFDDVTDGGMVEGLINGAFNSVSDSWNILNSGVSISGISVGGIVSSVVILLVAYFALKVIQR